MGFLKVIGILTIVGFSIPMLTLEAASETSPDLMKKCREMMIKAHPPSPAGSRGGTAQQQRDYFKTCIARNGNMDK